MCSSLVFYENRRLLIVTPAQAGVQDHSHATKLLAEFRPMPE
jgi:hypothetical protein